MHYCHNVDLYYYLCHSPDGSTSVAINFTAIHDDDKTITKRNTGCILLRSTLLIKWFPTVIRTRNAAEEDCDDDTDRRT